MLTGRIIPALFILFLATDDLSARIIASDSVTVSVVDTFCSWSISIPDFAFENDDIERALKSGLPVFVDLELLVTDGVLSFGRAIKSDIPGAYDEVKRRLGPLLQKEKVFCAGRPFSIKLRIRIEFNPD